jgi:hypothetical protein
MRDPTSVKGGRTTHHHSSFFCPYDTCVPNCRRCAGASVLFSFSWSLSCAAWRKCFDLPLLPVHCGLLFLKFPMRPEEFIKQHRVYRFVVNSHYFALFTSVN